MSRTDLGERLAQRLYAAEAAIDRALAEAAELAAFLPRARAEAMIAATTGQAAFESSAAAIAALAAARGHVAHTHRTLDALGRRMGIDVSATGPMDKPENDLPNRPSGARVLFNEE